MAKEIGHSASMWADMAKEANCLLLSDMAKEIGIPHKFGASREVWYTA